MRLNKRRIQSYSIRMLATFLGMTLKAWMRTVDTRIADYEPKSDVALQGFDRPALYILWHEYILLPAATRRGSDMTLLVSQHRDAFWFSEIVENFGFKTVRGSTSHGGIKAILQYRKAHKETSLVLTPDGPRGPRRQMSPGCIQLSSLLQMPLIPVGCGYHSPYRLRTWDRFGVPRMGTRARMILGPKIQVRRKLDDRSVEEYRTYVEQVMHSLTSEAECWAMDGLPRENERALFAAPHASAEPNLSLGILS